MTSETMGRIFQLIQQSFLPAGRQLEDAEERRKRVELIRKNADTAKHDICAYIDAQAEMACGIIDGKHRLQGSFHYPENESLNGMKFVKTARNEWTFKKD